MFKFLSLLMLVLTTAGCSHFQRDWRKAAHQPKPAGIEGRWEGTWQSNHPGHSGKLRCVLTRIDDQNYEAHFHAKYKKILGFSYVAYFVGEQKNGTFSFAGQADLGKLAGGIYRYKGQTSSNVFFSTYNSKYDNGTFTMKRPR